MGHSAFWVQISRCTCNTFRATYFNFLCFSVVFGGLKWPPSIVLKFCLVSVKVRRLMEKISGLDRLPSGMNEHITSMIYVRCLNRNTHKTRLCIDTEVNVIRGSPEPNSSSPRSSELAHSVFTATF